jgi:hypothetical protein
MCQSNFLYFILAYQTSFTCNGGSSLFDIEVHKLRWKRESNEVELMIITWSFKDYQVYIIYHEHLMLLNLISCCERKWDCQSDNINHAHSFVICSSRVEFVDLSLSNWHWEGSSFYVFIIVNSSITDKREREKGV